MQLGKHADFRSPFFFRSLVSDLMRCCDGSDKGTEQILSKSRKSATETVAMIRQVHRKLKLTETKKARQTESKVKRMIIIFIDISGIVHKEFALEVKTVNSA
jgi:hypothetical protein